MTSSMAEQERTERLGGETVYIEYGDWVNKSLPRFEITIGCEGREDVQEESWPTLYGLTMEEASAHTIPWADYEMDYDAHREFMREVWFKNAIWVGTQMTGVRTSLCHLKIGMNHQKVLRQYRITEKYRGLGCYCL